MAILFPDLPEPTRVAVHRAVEALERSKRALTAANLSAARAGKQESDAAARADVLQANMADIKYARPAA